MKKLTAVLLVLMLALAMMPTVALAVGTTDLSADLPQTAAQVTAMKDGTYTNSDYGSDKLVHKVKLDTTAGNTFVFENVTFEPGVIFSMTSGLDGCNVTFKNCTFNGASGVIANNDYQYAIQISGGNVVVENCTFNGVYRGINMHHPAVGVGCTLTVTGCTFDLTVIAGTAREKNVGVQLAQPGWTATDTVNIDNNKFINAFNALRLHEKFAVADSVTTEKFIHFNGNVLSNGEAAIGLTTRESNMEITLDQFDGMVTRLQAIIDNNIDTPNTGTKVGLEVDPTYTIVIPAEVNFGTLQKTTDSILQKVNFDVSASNVFIEDGARIDVTVNSTFKLKSGNFSLDYELFQDLATDNEITNTGTFASFNENINKTQEGYVQVDTKDIPGAGAYSGVMTFTINYVAPTT